MFNLNAQEHPVVFVVLVGLAVGGLSHLLWLSLAARTRFKTVGDQQVVMYSVYLTAACAFLAWACIFLGQASPMVKPQPATPSRGSAASVED